MAQDTTRPAELEEAVILAAGRGSRLAGERLCAKCLVTVAGRPTLAWIVRALAEAGISRVHVVVGHNAGPLERAIADLQFEIQVSTTRCPDWELGNGRSALQSRAVLSPRSSGFLLLMSDHVISSSHVSIAIGAAAADEDASWLVTSPLGQVHLDLDDATKVSTDERGYLRAIGKDLVGYDAIDTGVFVFRPAVFSALEQAAATGDYSLTGGNRVLVQRRALRAVSAGKLRWQDIDTAEDLERARLDAKEILCGLRRGCFSTERMKNG